MDRQSPRSGFALLELLVSVMVLSVLTVLTVRLIHFTSQAYYTFPDQYTRIKSESILTGEKRDYEDETEMDYPPIRFSEYGNINQARTISFPKGQSFTGIILELGPGALVFRD